MSTYIVLMLVTTREDLSAWRSRFGGGDMPTHWDPSMMRYNGWGVSRHGKIISLPGIFLGSVGIILVGGRIQEVLICVPT